MASITTKATIKVAWPCCNPVFSCSGKRLNLSPWLQANHKVEQLVLLRRVLNVEHEARELLHVLTHSDNVLEFSQLLTSRPSSIYKNELNMRLQSVYIVCPPPELGISGEVHGVMLHVPKEVLQLLGTTSSAEWCGLWHLNPGWFDCAHKIGQRPLHQGNISSHALNNFFKHVSEGSL
ncbi:hypothetical protein AMTRI_Chr09g16640 [Amborella trichopoda]